MRITVMTLFPEFFDSFQTTSIIKKALDKKLVEFDCVDYRQFTLDKHNHVDDTPCGGGVGMLLMVQPIVDCLKAIKTENSHVVLMCPQGKTFNQTMARNYATNYDHLILICGHYEGYDERIRDYVDEEVSLGDFVLTGGEIAAMTISDAIIRLLDGVITKQSHEDDSFENGLLEYPQYTRPVEYDGKKVPEVLLSGHHENIRKWRLKESLRKTYLKRPDLIEKRELNKEEKKFLEEIFEEINKK